MQSEPSHLTPYQALSIIKSRVKVPFNLHEGIAIQRWMIDADLMHLTVQVSNVIQRRFRTIFQPVKLCVYLWHRGEDDSWTEPEVITAPLTEPALHVVPYARDAVEAAERARYAAACYRPGTPRSPMDGAHHDNPTIRLV